MSQQKVAAWSHAEEFVTPSDHIEAAHRRAVRNSMSTLIGNGAGGVAAACSPPRPAPRPSWRSAPELASLVSGSSAGCRPDGILTTIDIEAEHQRAAREAFAAAGIAHQRTRVIAGRALDVLPRMTDSAYDLVVVDADKAEYPEYVAAGVPAAAPRRHPAC